MPENYISLAEAARLSGVSPDYLNVLVHRGKLKAKKIGRNWVTTEEFVNQYLASRGEVTPGNAGADAMKLAHELEMTRLQLGHKENILRLEMEKKRHKGGGLRKI